MFIARSREIGIGSYIAERVRIYTELVKFRLSFLVAFTSAFGFVLASHGAIDWFTLAVVSIGGFLVSGASITLNQIAEKEYDGLMERTKNRPLPTERISVQEAYGFALVLSVLGFGMLLLYTNLLTTLLSVVSMILYSFVYTPMKRVGPLAVLVGAFPGALPPLLGWTAATGMITAEALIIFGIQFIWQFPHFWAIAWVADEDYKKAGFKMLPLGGKKDFNTAVQIMTYTMFLIPLGLLPAKLGITGMNSALVATICGVLFLAQTFKLMRNPNRQSALKIMFGSFLYLPVVQIAYLLDKI